MRVRILSYKSTGAFTFTSQPRAGCYLVQKHQSKIRAIPYILRGAVIYVLPSHVCRHFHVVKVVNSYDTVGDLFVFTVALKITVTDTVM